MIEVRAYDAEGELVQTTSQAYDHLNRWVRTENSPATGPAEARRFVYDGDQIILALDGNEQPTARYLWGPAVDLLLAEDHLGAAPKQYWPLGDHQNSVRHLVERNPQTGVASVVDHVVFSAFGEETHDSNSAVGSLFGFTGRPLDPSTGLQNNLHRWYDAALTQWLSEDPIGFTAGDPNPRRYVGNDPVNKVDPSGLFDLPPLLSGGWMANWFPDVAANSAPPEPEPTRELQRTAVNIDSRASKYVIEKGFSPARVGRIQDLEKLEQVFRMKGWNDRAAMTRQAIGEEIQSWTGGHPNPGRMAGMELARIIHAFGK